MCVKGGAQRGKRARVGEKACNLVKLGKLPTFTKFNFEISVQVKGEPSICIDYVTTSSISGA